MIDLSEITWFRFKVPLRRPLIVGGKSLTYREGLVVGLQSRDGSEGWGEAAPLPGFHGWCPVQELIKHARLVGQYLDETRSRGLPPSIRFAISAAEAWLLHGGDTGEAKLRREVQATFLIDRGNQSRESLHQAAGFRCIKVKVGGEPTADAAFIKEVRDAVGPEPKLRADANRRWTVDQALEFGNAVGPEVLEFIEEPCADPNDFDILRNETGLRIAADESVQDATDLPAIERILDSSDYLVIKPTMVGSLDRCRELAYKAYARDAGVVISSAYETGIGMRGLLLLIRSLKDSDPAPGLGTYDLITKDLLETRLPIEGASFNLDSALRPVKVDKTHLERIA